jgi:excisionase family DNA binding protein
MNMSWVITSTARRVGASRPVSLRVTELLAEREAGDGPAPAQPDRLTVGEAAALARVTRSAVYRWLGEDKLTRHGSTGRVLIDRAELEKLLGASPPQLRAVRSRPRTRADDRFSRMARR